MNDILRQFRENETHVTALREFLLSESGRELQNMLRGIRSEMTSDDLCESRLLGRHDVFQKLDDLLFVSTVHLEPRNPVSGKSQRTSLKPATTKLP